MTNRKLRIAFMGTPVFAVRALDALWDMAQEDGHEIVAVYTQPPKPAGRGYKLQPSPVHKRAEELGIPVHHPKSLKKSPEARAAFSALDLDIAVVAAYGLILPKEVLDAPGHGCINIHASLLPRWRGAAPIQRAIMAGDDKSGVCIMRVEEALDAGPVLMRGETPITATTTASSLHDALAEIGADLAVKTIRALAAGRMPEEQPQPEEGVTYAHMLNKDDGRIDWNKSAGEIERQMRALTPWPGVWCLHGEQRVKVLEAQIEKAAGKQGAPGEVIDRHLIVACGEGSLRITRLQPQDRKPMDGLSFVNGAHLSIGGKLS
ncbi:MAG: methionyl-tRNA formyltransferase [Alphaproteobacteria bacterium]|nr:methionyl-tRNA formyltransferase [Alphaproteobacteria bacterium]